MIVKQDDLLKSPIINVIHVSPKSNFKLEDKPVH